MKVRAFAGATTAAVCALMLASGPVDAASTTGTGIHTLAKTYSSCAKLNKDFKHGITDKKNKSKSWWVARGATAKGAYRPGIYKNVHKNLDRDKDHIACEK